MTTVKLSDLQKIVFKNSSRHTKTNAKNAKNAKNVKNDICKNYKYDVLGKENKKLYNSCKINQYCRKYKCKNIDKKFNKAKFNKIGVNNDVLLMSSIFRKCPITMNEKNRQRCVKTATKKFYNSTKLGDMYNKVLECDKTTCANERKIFYKNIFRLVKTKKQIRSPPMINLEELPDEQMIEKN